MAVNAKVTKVSGRDHRGEFRIGWRGQVKLQHTLGEVGMSASLQARQLKEFTQEGSQLIGMALVSDFLATVAMYVNANYLNTSQLERYLLVSEECLQFFEFELTSNYNNKVNTFCI